MTRKSLLFLLALTGLGIAHADDPWSRVTLADKPHAPLLERQADLPEDLVRNPTAIAAAVLTTDLAGLITETKAEFDSMENPSEATVTVTERGILDDDLLGVRHRVSLARNKNKEWRVTGYQRGELRRKHLNQQEN